MIQGVDYASVDQNKAPDISAARNAGVRFSIVRGSYTNGGIAYPDPHMTRDRDAWGRNSSGPVNGGFGSYMILGFGPNDPTPQLQARTFIATYGRRRLGELPPTLDVEFPHGRAATGLSAQESLHRCEDALEVLQGYYGIVMTYTSSRVWQEDLEDQDSAAFGSSPLWIKTPYVYKAGNKPHPEACPTEVGELPRPWRSGGPGAWVHQFQGDAKAMPGFTSTVDLNRWMTRDCMAHTVVPGSWIAQRLSVYNMADIWQFQRILGLTVDGVIGPATFALLTA